MNKVQKVFEKCQSTVSWLGIKINSVDERNEFGNTPLHTACTWGDLDSVRTLLEAGANVNAQGEHGATPIFNGMGSKNRDLIEMLLTHGAEKDVKIFGSTSLAEYAKSIGANNEILALLEKWPVRRKKNRRVSSDAGPAGKIGSGRSGKSRKK